MKDPSRAPAPSPFTSFKLPNFTVYQIALIAVLVAAAFTRFYRLGSPDQCYFDEVYFPTTGAEILRGDTHAWDFYTHENTHPPLSKLFMAAGEGIFGKENRGGTDNQCWGDPYKSRATNPDWAYSPFGWRFFGALAGVGAVVFMYLLAKRLFRSEIAALAAAFLLTFDGLAFVQSRIATPDTYVLFFVLGCVYFLVSNRLLLSGLFFGAGAATKWNAFFAAVPILLYFVWRVYRAWRETEGTERPRLFEIVLPAGLAVLYGGVALTLWRYVVTKAGETYSVTGGPFEALGLAMMVGGGLAALVGIAGIALEPSAQGQKGRIFTPRGRVLLEVAVLFAVFFMIVPSYVYIMTYVPMLLNGHSLGDVRDLNRMAYDFHSHLRTPHPYSSSWYKWPVLVRPIYFYVGPNNAKIYNLGNPVIFWSGLPAVVFALFQGLRRFRLNVDSVTGRLSVRATLTRSQAVLLLVVASFLGFWLVWAAQPRILFLYHYLPALAFLILALAYTVDWLWHQRLSRDIAVAGFVFVAAAALNRLGAYQGMSDLWTYVSYITAAAGVIILSVGVARLAQPGGPPDIGTEERWGPTVAVTFLVVVLVTFIYFYPHLAAVKVSNALDESYYWIQSWR